MLKSQAARKMGALAVPALALTLFVSAPATAVPSSGPDDETPIVVPDVDMTNVGIVARLDYLGKCLFGLGVYPTDLPGGREPVETYRTELLRAFPGQLGGVTVDQDEEGQVVAATVHSLASSQLAGDGLEAATRELPLAFEEAARALETAGVNVSVVADSLFSVESACAAQTDLIASAAAHSLGLPKEAAVLSTVDEATGRLRVWVAREWLEPMRAWAKPYGDLITFSEIEGGNIEGQGRGDDYFPGPDYGGSKIRPSNSYAGWCSDSFKIGGTAMLTANHCGYKTWVPYNPAVGTVVGTTYAAYSLGPAGVDVNLIAGGPFSNQVWMGSTAGTSLRQVTGWTSYANVPIGGYYKFSGASSGEGTVIVQQKNVHAIWGNGSTYGAYIFVTGESICKGGDSGGAYMVWNSSPTAPFQALAVHVAGPSDPNTTPRTCVGVNMDTINYLYGGITVG